jgi:hypothetical protein
MKVHKALYGKLLLLEKWVTNHAMYRHDEKFIIYLLVTLVVNKQVKLQDLFPQCEDDYLCNRKILSSSYSNWGKPIRGSSESRYRIY